MASWPRWCDAFGAIERVVAAAIVLPILPLNHPRVGDRMCGGSVAALLSDEKGLYDMIRGVTEGGRRLGIAALVACVVSLSFAGAVLAQGQLSEKAVRTFMDYAWSLTPQKFTTPGGKAILIDKKKRELVEVPVENARQIIMAGRLTAHAQMCDLSAEVVANYQSLMNRERASGKWSEQQIVYINQLHLTTVMLLTGQIKVVDKTEGERKVIPQQKPKTNAKTCTDEQKTEIRRLVEEYVKSEQAAKSN